MNENQRIGSYRLLEVIGQGAMGTVYKALDEELQAEVAIKILHPHLTRMESIRKRFHNEGIIQARMGHDSFVRVIRKINEGDQLALVMEYVEGTDLSDYLQRFSGACLAPGRAFSIMKRLLEAFSHAHGMGAIHRDIKPSNILICEQDGYLKVKIMDFGIAKLIDTAQGEPMTRVGTDMYTPGYSSPEQLKHPEDVDQRADVFSLGMTLYKMLTGRLPFSSENDLEYKTNICKVDAPSPREFRPDLEEDLAQIVLKAIARDRENRFSTCSEFLVALRGCFPREGREPTRTPTLVTDPATLGIGLWPWVAGIAVVLVVVLAIIYLPGKRLNHNQSNDPRKEVVLIPDPPPPDPPPPDWTRNGVLYVQLSSPGYVRIGQQTGQRPSGPAVKEYTFKPIPIGQKSLTVWGRSGSPEVFFVNVTAGEKPTQISVSVE